MDKEIIRQVGLSDNEAEVYLLLLQLGEGLASEIAEKSKISRPHIYDTIAKLIDKGLASYVMKNSRRVFRPADPEVLMDLLKSKQMSLHEALPLLKKLYAPAKEKPVVEVYEGNEGLKTILNDLLRNGKEFSAFGPTTEWKKRIPIAVERYFRQREKIGFRGKLLSSEGKEAINHKLNSIKYLPKEFSSPATTIMYGDKTTFILWLDSVISVTVKNKELFNSFKSYFDLMWNAQATTYIGKEGAYILMNDILTTKPNEYILFGGRGRMWDLIPEYEMEYKKRRELAKIKVRRIFNDTIEARKISAKYSSYKYREHKFIPVNVESPLITCVYNNKTWLLSWTRENPIMILIENKDIAEGFKNQFNQLWNQEERIYRGIEGLKNVLTKIIEDRPKELCVYGSSGASIKLFPKFIEQWHKQRAKNDITLKIIYTDSKESRQRVAKYKPNEKVIAKFMPGGYESPLGTVIYGNKVILMAIAKKGFATVIENKDITEIYKKQFDTIWRISKTK